MNAPKPPKKSLADLTASELRKYDERTSAYNSYLNKKLIDAGYGHVKFSELRTYIHDPKVRAYLEYWYLVREPVLIETGKRNAWHGDLYKPVPVKYRRNPDEQIIDPGTIVERKPKMPKRNPAPGKKRVSKKIAGKKLPSFKPTPARKKTAAKKVAAKKRIAVAAPSRATGKAPSARLKKRRARNTVKGAYPNPKPRGVASKIYAVAFYGGEPRIYVFDGAKFVPSWAEGKAYKTAQAASKAMHAMREKLPRSIEKIGVFPGYLSDSTIYRELTGKNRGMGK